MSARLSRTKHCAAASTTITTSRPSRPASLVSLTSRIANCAELIEHKPDLEDKPEAHYTVWNNPLLHEDGTATLSYKQVFKNQLLLKVSSPICSSHVLIWSSAVCLSSPRPECVCRAPGWPSGTSASSVHAAHPSFQLHDVCSYCFRYGVSGSFRTILISP